MVSATYDITRSRGVLGHGELLGGFLLDAKGNLLEHKVQAYVMRELNGVINTNLRILSDTYPFGPNLIHFTLREIVENLSSDGSWITLRIALTEGGVLQTVCHLPTMRKMGNMGCQLRTLFIARDGAGDIQYGIRSLYSIPSAERFFDPQKEPLSARRLLGEKDGRAGLLVTTSAYPESSARYIRMMSTSTKTIPLEDHLLAHQGVWSLMSFAMGYPIFPYDNMEISALHDGTPEPTTIGWELIPDLPTYQGMRSPLFGFGDIGESGVEKWTEVYDRYRHSLRLIEILMSGESYRNTAESQILLAGVAIEQLWLEISKCDATVKSKTRKIPAMGKDGKPIPMGEIAFVRKCLYLAGLVQTIPGVDWYAWAHSVTSHYNGTKHESRWGSAESRDKLVSSYLTVHLFRMWVALQVGVSPEVIALYYQHFDHLNLELEVERASRPSLESIQNGVSRYKFTPDKAPDHDFFEG